jgi:hypothetical protein
MVPDKIKVLVPITVQEPRVINVCRAEPFEVVRDVVTCRSVPVCCVDPCTGCTYTTCRLEQVVQKVKCVQYRTVTEQQKIMVNVCRMQEQVRDIQVCKLVPKQIMVDVCTYQTKEEVVNVTRCVPYTYTEEQVVTRRFCVMVPYQATVRVPVCTPVCSTPCCQ